MEIVDALKLLNIRAEAEWDAVRRAHRAAIVRVHPDAGGSAEAAALVNQAFDLLAAATAQGERPLPRPVPVAAPPVAPSPTRTVSADDPTEVLLRLADVAHDVGEVVFVDPDAGLLEVIVGTEPAVGQLTASIEPERRGDGVPVAFTLEALGVTPAPPIEEVVADLMRRLRRRSPSESHRFPAEDEFPH